MKSHILVPTNPGSENEEEKPKPKTTAGALPAHTPLFRVTLSINTG